MKTLDEIAKEWDGSLEDAGIAEKWAWDYGPLLIRAVRQLGQTAKGEGFPDYWTGSEWREVDDDVVALLEEGR